VRLCASSGAKFEAGHVLAKYPLNGTTGTRGLVFARLVRIGAKGWGFEALAWGCPGRSAKDTQCLNVVRGITEPI
jgi:hypothetical protein